jgi:DNA-binding LacI/PurR family transcriptional regulator
MTVRLADVAALAGVSVKTVSNVVNGFRHVSPDTRRRVEEAVDALGYRPNQSARTLRLGRSGVVALAVPALDAPYFAELGAAVVAAAARHGLTLLVDQTDGLAQREREVVAGLRANVVDGLILSPMTLSAADLERTPPSLPVVLLGERIREGVVDHVAVDNEAAAQAVTQHLLETGRSRVAAIGYQEGAYSASGVAPLRRAGYERALAARDVPVRRELTPVVPTYSRAEGAAAMRSLLDRGDPPDAVFCFNDVLALGALHELRRRGLRVPDDVAVAGFDDIEDGRFSSPSLSTVGPDKQLIADTAVQLLSERLVEGSEAPARDVTVPFQLIVRESTGGA